MFKSKRDKIPEPDIELFSIAKCERSFIRNNKMQ